MAQEAHTAHAVSRSRSGGTLSWLGPEPGLSQRAIYTKLSSIFYHSDEVFDAAGDRQPTTIYGSDFRANQGFLYLECGLLERLTVINQVSGASLESENNIRHNVLRLTTSVWAMLCSAPSISL